MQKSTFLCFFFLKQDTLKQYRLELGLHHRLTLELQAQIAELKEEAAACAVRFSRRDFSFLGKSIFQPSIYRA